MTEVATHSWLILNLKAEGNDMETDVVGQVAALMFYLEFSAHFFYMIYQTGSPHTGVIS